MADLNPSPGGYPIKLVRDHTAAIINASGEPGELFYGPCPKEDVDGWLRKKLVEEVAEYLVNPCEDELCDVLAVVSALARRHNSGTLRSLRAKMLADKRGGFFNAVMMYGRHEEFDGRTDG